MRIKRNSSSGMALMEVMMAVGILSIVTLGITTTISQSMKSQKDSALLGALTNSKVNLTRVILDGAAWKNTVAANPSSLSCLASNTSCNATMTVGNYPLPITILYDAANNKYVDNSSPTNGFTPMGVTGNTGNSATNCSSFVQPVAGAGPSGVDSCPIQYVLGARFDCPGGVASCVQPVVTVQAKLVYNPSSTGHSVTAINTTTYSPVVVRGAGNFVRNDSVFIAQQENTTSNGGGACTTAPAPRIYTSGVSSAVLPTVDTASSTGKYVPTAGVGQGNILNVTGEGVELKAGGYICDISAVAWAVNGWTLQLTYNGASPTVTTNVIAQATSYAKKEGSYAQSEIVLPKVHIDLANDTFLTVWQTCSTNATTVSPLPPYEVATSPANVANFAMGIPINSAGAAYGLSVYSSISCTRVY